MNVLAGAVAAGLVGGSAIWVLNGVNHLQGIAPRRAFWTIRRGFFGYFVAFVLGEYAFQFVFNTLSAAPPSARVGHVDLVRGLVVGLAGGAVVWWMNRSW
jgi:hypothetical protein